MGWNSDRDGLKWVAGSLEAQTYDAAWSSRMAPWTAGIEAAAFLEPHLGAWMAETPGLALFLYCIAEA